MQVLTTPIACRLGDDLADVLAFDLEMANSFQNERPVICMIGTEHYDPASGECRFTHATITAREEEPELIRWFIEHLEAFVHQRETPRLLSFSGLDNDLPWLRERFGRYGYDGHAADVLGRFENLDLQREFHRRTQHNRISLKRLEELFGIERQATLSSRKVSYILTNLLKDHANGDREIPERLVDYLREDVHHLMLIFDKWTDKSLASENLTEIDYLNQTNSLLRLTRKVLRQHRYRQDVKKDVPALEALAEGLQTHLEHAVQVEGFDEFELPALPPLHGSHPDLGRVQKKHAALAQLEVWNPETNTYRLGRFLNKPKGVLGVVRRQNKLLMIRRADHLERAAGYWGLPGGTMEPGETLEEAVERELAEELDLDGKAGALLGVNASFSAEFLLFWMEVDVPKSAQATPQDEEVADVRWVTPTELHALDPLIPGATEGFRQFLGPEWVRRKRK